MDENEISRGIVTAAIEVHKTLGPGLLESIYRNCLKLELESTGLVCGAEVPVTATYKGHCFDSAFRIDLLVEDKVIVELKVVDHVLPVHEAQLLSYLKLTGKKLGLLINFHVSTVKNGIKRIVNNF